MAGYIVLCDHNIEWQEEFRLKLDETGINAICIENVYEIEDYMDAAGFMNIIVCSLVELKEYIKMFGTYGKDCKSFFEKNDVFVISDKQDDEEEINAFRAGCADFQNRERNISIILQRLISLYEKKLQGKKIIIKTDEMTVEYKDISIAIKDNEAKLLKLLLNSNKEFVSVEKICKSLWGKCNKETRINLASLVYRLRKKMPNDGKCIRSIYGKGYYLSKNEIQTCV